MATIANRMIATIVLVFALASTAHAGSVIFVDDDAPPGGDGLSWDTAYRFLQDGLSHASGSALALGGGDVSEIHVAQGTYKPDRDEANPNGTGDREASFNLINNVALIGGYAGIGAKDPNARDIEVYVSNFDGNIGNTNTPNDNSFHLTIADISITESVMDGFTITNSWANGDNSPQDHGGGLLIVGGQAIVKNCNFISNIAFEWGSAIAIISNGHCTVLDCTFTDNIGDNGGVISVQASSLDAQRCTFLNNDATVGGVFSVNENSEVALSECTFISNTADAGGAMWIEEESQVDVKDCIFSDNSVSNRGGAFAVFENSSLTLLGCEFTNNVVEENSGGALDCHDSDIEIADCTFIGNCAWISAAISLNKCNSIISRCEFRQNFSERSIAAVGSRMGTLKLDYCTFVENNAGFLAAGALAISSDLSATISNCQFIGNDGTEYGGGVALNETPAIFINCSFWGNTADEGAGMSIDHSQPILINCTFATNFSSIDGGGFFASGSSSDAIIVGCLFWGNSDPGGTDETAQIFIENGDLDIDFSCIQGLTGQLGGIGNIGNNPLFIDADGTDDIPGNEDDDLRLSPGSPCIDAADNTALPKDVTTDLDGNPRFVDDPDTDDTGNGKAPIVDMGAYEFQPPLVAPLDIKPGSCPNPFNTKSHGMMPAAILGTKNFDTSLIDIASLTIARADGIGESVAPNEGPPGPHSTFDDVGTPFEGELCDCHDLDGDGITDLVMHFSTPQMVEALQLSDLPGGSQVELVISGTLTDSTPFTATDCISLVPPGDMDGDGAVTILDMIILFSTWGSCNTCIDCPADLDGDCEVNISDLLILLSNWS